MTSVAAVRPPAYVGTLPPRPGHRPHPHLTYCPVGRVLELVTGKGPTAPARRYYVADLPFVPAPGRAFRLHKVGGPGTDPEARDYAVFIAADPRRSACECKGFLRWGHCSHVDGLAKLVADGAVTPPGTAAAVPVRPTPARALAEF